MRIDVRTLQNSNIAHRIRGTQVFLSRGKSFIRSFHQPHSNQPALTKNQTVADVQNQTHKYRTSSKCGPKQAPNSNPSFASEENLPKASIQAKLVLLTLTFPRLRIIWSSSPFASSEIFLSLKSNQSEPDPKRALLVGADESIDPDDPSNPNPKSKPGEGGGQSAGAGEGVNTAAEDLLRTFPGITAKNVRYVMKRVSSVRALCEMKLEGLQELLGSEPGKACFEFLHRKK